MNAFPRLLLLQTLLTLAGSNAWAADAAGAPQVQSSPSSSAKTETDVPRSRPERAESKDGGPALLQPDTELIDEPTAAILDYGGFSSRSRFFSNGGVVEWGSFGVFQRLNIGGSLNIDHLLGTYTPVQLTAPQLQAKIRLYDGDRTIPAFALGFDGQGYLYNHPVGTYNQRQRGVYVVGTQEVAISGLNAQGGMNISDFNSNAIFGFIGADYNIRDKVLLMTEWDNLNNIINSRFNAGVRVFITSSFNLDFAARGIGQGGHFSDGVSRGAERIIEFKYTGNF